MSRLALLDRAKLNLADVAVLVVGGATMATDILMSMLSGFGTGQLRRADSVEEAQEVCRKSPVDAVIIDSTLGREPCEQLMRWLRRQKSDSRFSPILLVAANPQLEGVGEARDSGVSYVVAKPVTPRVVFERLVWVVREKRAFIEADGYVGPDRRWRRLGPPPGCEGRRSDDLGSEIGDAVGPNLSQNELDALMTPVRGHL